MGNGPLLVLQGWGGGDGGADQGQTDQHVLYALQSQTSLFSVQNIHPTPHLHKAAKFAISGHFLHILH